MSYKPDEGILIAYLYNELAGKEKEMLQQYLEENPEELKKLQEMASMLKVMGNIADKEVIAPPIFDSAQHQITPFWKSNSFKTVISVAASILLLLVAGKVIGPEIKYGDGELRISFGATKVEKPVIEKIRDTSDQLTASAVQQMINESMVKSSKEIDARWSQNQQALNSSIHQSLDQNSKKVDELVKNTSQASQDQLRSYVSSLQTENLRLMKDYFQLSAKEQNAYVEKLMIGFSKYVQEQRTQDLMVVQNKMDDIEKNSDQFKQETEQLLASIISKKKSY